MADRKVPLGISIITILMYIGAIFDIAAGIFLIVDQEALAEASDVSESTILGIGIALIAVGVVIGLLAWGLRSASNGVRLFIAAIMVLRIAFSIYAIIAVPAARYEGLVTGIIAVVVLYILYGSEDSKVFFGDKPAMAG